MKDIEIWKYDSQELAHHHLILHGIILPDFLESIIPLDKYHRIKKDKSDVTCYDCDVQHYITKGSATIITKDGKQYKIGKGDCLCIKRGISCSWHINKTLKMRVREF